VKHSRRYAAGVAIALIVSGAATFQLQRDSHHYLSAESADFVARFNPPTAPGSAQTRRELDELLALEHARSAADVAAARADRKTEIGRFYAALGLDAKHPPDLPQLRGLMQRVEDDVRPYVRAAKMEFRRMRPYVIEQSLHPCIDDVRRDLSYPSGHAAYGYVMTDLLADMVPERRRELRVRADEFARQRMVCGVHFRSDLEAGRQGARWLAAVIARSPDYRRDMNAARAELRAALRLPPLAPTAR